MSPIARLRWWLGWIAVTSVSGALALLMAGLFVPAMWAAQGSTLDRSDISGDNGIIPFITWCWGLVLFVGPLLGFGQGLLIRRLATNLQWQKWIGLTILGVAASIFLHIAASLSCSFICGAALPGLVLSFAQWLILRDAVKHAYLWIVVNCAAWIFAVLLGPPLTNTILRTQEMGHPFYPFEAVLIFSLKGFIFFASFAVWTGALLIWMLNNGPPTREVLTEAC